ncbi:hypothetical protein UZ36_01360 [Candidatus Nitromaritima sp. SCGC AAA799-C22]|nr:hypothetical protein UZ36_01360 [Candidatus Nitromaritima sp. SCGC AAA799-C22]
MSDPSPFSRSIKYVFTAGVFAVFGWMLFKYREDFYIIQEISALQFIEISLLILMGVTLNGSKLRRIAGAFDVRLRTSEWFALSSLTTVLNSVFFKAGSLAASGYLKKKHGFPYLSFAGTFLGDQLIILFAGALTGSAVSLHLGLSGNKDLLPIFGVFALIAVLLFFLMRGRIHLPERKNTFFDLLRRGIESFNNLLHDKDLLYSLGIHNLFLIVTIGLRFYVACSILQLGIPLSHCFLFATVMMFVRVVPVTHSDIGVRELAVGFLSGILGSGLKAGMLATVVDRIFELFWTALCTGAFKHTLMTPKTENAEQVSS